MKTAIFFGRIPYKSSEYPQTVVTSMEKQDSIIKIQFKMRKVEKKAFYNKSINRSFLAFQMYQEGFQAYVINCI